MGIFLEHSTFYHIPRTGGSWVENVLLSKAISGNITIMTKYLKGVDSVINRKHITPLIIRPRNFSFTFIRHPLEWYKSIWKYRTRSGKWKSRNYSELSVVCSKDNFYEFINAVIENYPNGYYNKIVDQFLSVDFVGKQENLIDDLITALTIAKETFNEKVIRNYKKVNVSRNINLKYTTRQKQKILNMEKSIIHAFY